MYWRNCTPNLAQWLYKTVHGENKGVMMERAKSDLIATCERRRGSSDIGAFVRSFITKLLFAHVRANLHAEKGSVQWEGASFGRTHISYLTV